MLYNYRCYQHSSTPAGPPLRTSEDRPSFTGRGHVPARLEYQGTGETTVRGSAEVCQRSGG